MAEIERKVWLTFPKAQVEQPIICQMARKFEALIFDIRQASVSEDLGIMALLLRADADTVGAAIDFLRSKGLTVEPVEKHVIEG